MLRKETVERLTFELLSDLMKQPALSDFYLAGGTALSLQIGHRKSIDIDLFTPYDFDSLELHKYFSEIFTSAYKNQALFRNTLLSKIHNVKCDFITHKYPLISSIETIDNIRIASLPDIVAMKINAMYGSGQRVKDFIDIYYLLDFFSIKQMMEFYESKYPADNPAFALKSITYFNDIDTSEWPEMTDKKLTWEKVKKRLVKQVRDYLLKQK